MKTVIKVSSTVHSIEQLAYIKMNMKAQFREEKMRIIVVEFI